MSVYKLSASGGLKTGRTMYTSMLAGNAAYDPVAHQLISSTVLTSDQSTVTISNIDAYASTYKHLQLVMLLKGQGSSASTRLGLRVNGSTSVMPRHGLGANGATVFSWTGGAMSNATVITDRISRLTNNYSPVVVDILEPFNTAKNTTFKIHTSNVDSSSSESALSTQSCVYLNTENISSLAFACGNQSWADEAGFAAGSRFSLYGIKG